MVKEVFIKVKHLIKKILREESVDSYLGTFGDEFETRIRIMMKRLQKIPNLDKFIVEVKNKGFDRNYFGGINQWVKTMTQEIGEIPKLFGGASGNSTEMRNNFVWMAVNTFINNGGYQRDFSDTNDPLDLSPITVYEVDALYSQPMKEYGSTWGVTYGSSNEQEAGEMYMDSYYNWESDRQHDDTDDYGETDVYEINKVESIELEFTKGVLGLT